MPRMDLTPEETEELDELLDLWFNDEEMNRRQYERLEELDPLV